MKKHMIIGIIIGVFFSGIVYAVTTKKPAAVLGVKDIKIEIQGTSGNIARGRVLVKIDEKWYRFENSPYMSLIKGNK